MNPWFPGGSPLTASDYLLVGAVLAALCAVGWKTGARAASGDDYLLAGRRLPWPAAGLALTASEISALTVLGVAAYSFRADWTSLQLFVGAAAARVLVALLFVPAFHRSSGRTIYGVLGDRFGPRTRAASAAAFLAARLLVSAVRLLVACAAAGALLGWGFPPTLILLTAVSLVVLVRGGAEPAVWTGAIETGVVLGAGLLAAVFLLRRADGGFPAALHLAAAAGKLRVTDWGFSAPAAGFFARFMNDPSLLWTALLTGFVGSAAAFGADHELAQKLMVVPDDAAGRKALYLSIAGSAAVLLVYLSVGTLLWVYYKQNPGMALPDQLSRVLPNFALTVMPRIVRGAVLAAVLAAAVDSPLPSLSAVALDDLWRPFSRRAASAGRELRFARVSSVVFALALAGLAALFASSEAALSVAFKAGAAAAGPLLGLFLLALTSERGGDAEALAALGVSVALCAGLLWLGEGGLLPFGWSWLVPAGAAASYGVGWGLSGLRARA
jgi:Na+/proline symporter